MGVWADERAQSIQIGAILLFGILILAFVGYQATVVPNQNAGVEAVHSQDVQADMVDVRNTILGTAATGDARPASVDLGPTYPARAMFINPGPPAGTLETVELGGSNQIRVSNAEAVDPETADYWDGSTTHTYATRGIQYVPQYNVYSNAPTSFYENSLLYNRFDRASVSADAETLDGTVMVDKTGQTLVDGRTITLIALQGDRDVSTTQTVSIDPEVVSAPMRTVTVQRSGAPVTVTVPTQLSEDTWRRLLDPELDSNGGYITAVSVSGGELTLEFQETGSGGPISYELRLGGVSVGDGSSPPAETYMVAVDGDDTSIVEGSTQKLVVEVRDEYNNPVSGVTVDASTDSTFTNDDVSPTSATTDENGRAEFIYEAPPNTNGKKDVDITTTFDGGGSAEKDVVFDVRVVSLSGGGSNAPPNADFTFDPNSPAVGEQVDFTDQSVDPDGDSLTYTWDFGDGDTSTDQNPSHSYSSSGTYTVILTVDDGNGGSDTTTEQITVGGAGSAPSIDRFIVSDDSGNKYDATYDVSDADSDLQRVTITLIDQDGSIIDTKVVHDGSNTDRVSGTVDLKYGGNDTPSEARILAEDSAGRTTEQTKPVP